MGRDKRVCVCVCVRVFFFSFPSYECLTLGGVAGMKQVALWRAVWSSRAASGATVVTATPEYGPSPYFCRAPADLTGQQTLDKEKDALWRQTLVGAAQLRLEFAKWEKDHLLTAANAQTDK